METIYLAGGIFGLTDAQCNDWRDKVMKELAGLYKFRNPMVRNYRGKELDPGIVEEIVTLDKKDIRESDIVLVMAQTPSWGTAMEILYAYENGKDVISIVQQGRVSPWVIYHSNSLFLSLDEALEVLSEFK